MNLNGQEYESYYLTPEEKAVVDAMRAGASISATLHVDDSPNQLDKVDKFYMLFNSLTADTAFIHDRADFQLPYIGFSKFFRDSNNSISAHVTLRMERVVG